LHALDGGAAGEDLEAGFVAGDGGGGGAAEGGGEGGAGGVGSLDLVDVGGVEGGGEGAEGEEVGVRGGEGVRVESGCGWRVSCFWFLNREKGRRD
jgi:hypothetical protein